MVGAKSRTVGDAGEGLALRYLESRGLRLITRNFHCRLGEIDLVMRDGATIAIIEVRVRRTGTFVSAIESVDRHKQNRIVRATRLYLAQHERLAQQPLRFDVVAVESRHPGKPSLTWIRDAFRVE